MLKHFLLIPSVIFLLTVAMLLPFLPGRYDNLAVTISFMLQIFCWAGLLLVPVGLCWLWLEYRKQKVVSAKNTRQFAIASLVVLSLVLFLVSLGALTNYSFSFGILFLVIAGYVISKAIKRIKRGGDEKFLKFNASPLYLVIIPIALAVLRFVLITPAVNFSRNYAIKKSQPLIEAIEEHYSKTGKYPISLQALHSDILPGVTGIKQFHYEPNGAAFNVYFKQFSDELDVEEVVMYNKLGEHAFSAHLLDILDYSGQQLSLRRGDKRRFKLPHPNWIYIKLD